MGLALRVGVVVVVVVTFQVCGVWSMIVLQKMVSEVNAHLPVNRKFNPFGWWAGKYQRLFDEYRRLYPGGLLIRQFRRLVAVMVVVLVLSAIALFLVI